MRIQFNKREYIDLNEDNIKPIIEWIKEYHKKVVEHTNYLKKGEVLTYVSHEEPAFVWYLDLLVNPDSFDYYYGNQFCKLIRERRKKTRCLPFGFKEKKIYDEVKKEYTREIAKRDLYRSLVYYANSEELIPVDERIKEGIGDIDSLNREKELNPYYNYASVKKLYDLAMSEISLVKTIEI